MAHLELIIFSPYDATGELKATITAVDIPFATEMIKEGFAPVFNFFFLTNVSF